MDASLLLPWFQPGRPQRNIQASQSWSKTTINSSCFWLLCSLTPTLFPPLLVAGFDLSHRLQTIIKNFYFFFFFFTPSDNALLFCLLLRWYVKVTWASSSVSLALANHSGSWGAKEGRPAKLFRRKNIAARHPTVLFSSSLSESIVTQTCH